jgi:hypothetical protein
MSYRLLQREETLNKQSYQQQIPAGWVVALRLFLWALAFAKYKHAEYA